MLFVRGDGVILVRLWMRMHLSFPNLLRYHLLHGRDPCQETPCSSALSVSVHLPVMGCNIYRLVYMNLGILAFS